MDATLDKLVYITWESAAPPGISLLICLISAFANGSPYPVTFFFYISGKLYSHAFMMTINSRVSLRETCSKPLILRECDLQQMGIISPIKPISLALRAHRGGSLTTTAKAESNIQAIGPLDDRGDIMVGPDSAPGDGQLSPDHSDSASGLPSSYKNIEHRLVVKDMHL